MSRSSLYDIRMLIFLGMGVYKTFSIVFFAVILLSYSSTSVLPQAFANGESSDFVLGQPNLTTAASNLNGNSLNTPLGAITDTSGNLWVVDANNNRVLRYNSGFGNGDAASIVIGQPNAFSNSAGLSDSELDSPRGIGIDSDGNLWISDTANNRILKFSTPFSNGQTADFVIGQPDFDSNEENRATTVGVNTLSSPKGIFVDGLDVWVADSGNNRILKFVDPANTNDNADFVLGQSLFTTSNSGTSTTTLKNPAVVTVDGTNVWVADTENNRALKFIDPQGIDKIADLVLGQPDFVSHANNNLLVLPTTLNKPQAVAVDGAGNVWVSDGSNNRLLRYDVPTNPTGESADDVLGHERDDEGDPNFGGIAADTLFSPQSVFVSSGGDVWTADSANNRVLKYTTFVTGDDAATVIGQSSFTSNTAGAGSLTASSLGLPRGTLVDPSGNVWVADTTNNRILRYDTPLGANNVADFVLGQPDFTSNAPNRGGIVADNTLSSPRDLSMDHNGNLWVADTGNSRVLRFDDPVTTDGKADFILGQPNFITNLPNQGGSITTNSMNFPQGILVQFVPERDNSPDPPTAAFLAVVVADTGNDRVHVYIGPTIDDQASTLRVGRTGPTSASTMSGPTGISFGEGIWISDTGNNRVLRLDPNTGFTVANVLGQTVLTSNSAGSSDSELDSPRGITTDEDGNLWVTDSGNHRVLAFTSPTSDGQAASHVLGQQNFNSHDSNDPSLSASTLSSPSDVVSPGSGELWVADSSNNRVLHYQEIEIVLPVDDDIDNDGHDSEASGGDDCDDTNPDVNPSMAEVPYDGLDNDCADGDLTDVDGDGYDANQPINGTPDCDDTLPDGGAINPGATEIPNDGIDNNCDGSDAQDGGNGGNGDHGDVLNAIGDAKQMLSNEIENVKQMLLNAINSMESSISNQISQTSNQILGKIDSLQSGIFNQLTQMNNVQNNMFSELGRTGQNVDKAVTNTLNNADDLQLIKDQITQLQLQTGDGAQKIDISISEADGKESFLILTTVNGQPVDVEIDQILIIKKKGEISILAPADYEITALDEGLFTLKIDKKAFKDKKSVEILVSASDGGSTLYGAILFDDKLDKNTSQ